MGETLVKRTKVLYAAVGLMLFGALGVGLQVSETSRTVDVVAPALTDACKDYKFYNAHVEACGTAALATSGASVSPSSPAVAPGSSIVVADTSPLTSANR